MQTNLLGRVVDGPERAGTIVAVYTHRCEPYKRDEDGETEVWVVLLDTEGHFQQHLLTECELVETA